MKTVKSGERIAYGIGGLGASAYQVMVMTFITYFYTDVFGISAAAVGTLMLVSRIWDGINDPVMGIIADRTNTRWGRFRPYLLFVPPFLAVSFVLLFTTPNFGPSGKIIYAYITYIIYVMLYTMYDITSNSLAPAMTQVSDERKSLVSTFRTITGFAAIVAIAGLPAISALGRGNEARGYQLFAAIVALFCIAASWLAFFKTKERAVVTEDNKIHLKEYWTILKGSRPFLIFILFIIVSGIASNVQSGMNLHYMKHYIGHVEWFPVLTLIGLVTYIISAAFASKISKLVSTKPLLISAMVISIIILAFRFFLAKNYPQILFILTVFSGLTGGLAIVFTYMVANDMIDFIQWKHGKRSEGIVFAMIVFAQKLAMALGGSLSGFMLSIIGYRTDGAAQTAATVSRINDGMFFLPALLSVGAMIILLFYDLSPSKLKEINNTLKERNKQYEI